MSEFIKIHMTEDTMEIIPPLLCVCVFQRCAVFRSEPFGSSAKDCECSTAAQDSSHSGTGGGVEDFPLLSYGHSATQTSCSAYTAAQRLSVTAQ